MHDEGTVRLLQPIKRGDEEIREVAIRIPSVGALRGLKLTNVLQMDVNALSVLLPRISQPALLPDEVAGLDPADFMTLAARVVGFFMTPEAKAEAEAELRLN
ncbi:phage tail assembly protein [Maritimibacter sp. HL-12]|uniref:phage tail assembly protein n=1 Tax=Maritimibacter sp. HL-12 TaxID=1162418 RepID=UPI000A0F309B|nr:phage tail assembly protein [Maritimibacter sp. HL-12]SMH35807.1 Phage tail assembly chaperone protein, E, or 41 or 14 [Maritimibacter sp. HL-12]